MKTNCISINNKKAPIKLQSGMKLKTIKNK